MEYQIRFGSHAFCVPGDVVDHYIRLASAEQLRVLLVLLRDPGQASPAQIAAFLHISEEAVGDALAFWQQAGILSDSPGAAPQAASAFAFAPPAQAASPAPPPAVQGSSREIKLDPSEIVHMLEDSGSLRDLFFHAEKLLGTPLNHMEQRSLVWMHSYLGLSCDIILTLLGYCISIDKRSLSYAESIAISWVHSDITTLDTVQAEIERLTQAHTFTAAIRRRFEMKRSPTSQQKKYIGQWQSAGYSMELIGYAYEITVESIDKLNFKYIDSILRSWDAKGIRTPEEAMKERQNPAGKQTARRSQEKSYSQKELDEMQEYLSVVNRFKEESK